MLYARVLLLLMLPMSVHALEWQSASRLQGTHPASAEERAAIIDALGGKMVRYNFESDSRVLVHEGDLRIDGNLASGEILVVRGNLTVTGMYDDYRDDGIGVLVVLGDMVVGDVYSWGAIYVQGDLKASGLLMTVYNDFTFEVGGKVHARGLVISDKSADYTAGEIGAAWTDDRDDADLHRALREYIPEVFTHPDHLELDDENLLYTLRFDEERARDRRAAGEPVFRSSPASADLPELAARAIASDTTDAALLELIGRDPLIDQLISARMPLSMPVAKRLAAGGDPVVLGWLARSAPQLVLAKGEGAMTPELAAALVESAGTGEEDLLRVARHPDSEVRITLAQRSELSTALINRLAQDADARVRAAVLAAGQNVIELEPALLGKLLADESTAVHDALAAARLDAEQARNLLGKLSDSGVQAFAESLLRQSRGAWPTALKPDQIRALAEAVLALGKREATTAAYLVLPDAEQMERFDALMAERRLDLERILQESANVALLTRIVALADSMNQFLPYRYAENPYLTTPMQLDIVARAARFKPDPDASQWSTPEDLIEHLLGNDAVGDEALMAATELAFKRGINPADGGMQNALFHHRNLPPAAIEKLDARLRFSEDWALTVILQRRASADQVRRALPRWYDDDEALHAELATFSDLDGEAFFAALARAQHADLRDVAAWNLATPQAEVIRLIDDPEQEVAHSAALHPKLPPERRLRLIMQAQPSTFAYIDLDAKSWDELARSLPTREARLAAMERAAQARMRERLEKDGD